MSVKHKAKKTVTTKAEPPASVVTKFNKEKCYDHLRNVEEVVIEKFAGKPGANPYIWVNTTIKPLRDRLDAGESTLEFQNEVLAITPFEPKL